MGKSTCSPGYHESERSGFVDSALNLKDRVISPAKRKYAIALFFILCSFYRAQASANVCSLSDAGVSDDPEGWFWQNPLPQGNDLFNVAAIDGQHALAIGASGTILQTTDAGTTWNI